MSRRQLRRSRKMKELTMHIRTPLLPATGLPQLSALFFEAPRRRAELRPVVPESVESPCILQEYSAREEKQALRFAWTVGLAALVMWGVLFLTLATSLQVPLLL